MAMDVDPEKLKTLSTAMHTLKEKFDRIDVAASELPDETQCGTKDLHDTLVRWQQTWKRVQPEVGGVLQQMNTGLEQSIQRYSGADAEVGRDAGSGSPGGGSAPGGGSTGPGPGMPG